MKSSSREIFGIVLLVFLAVISFASWNSFFSLSLHPDIPNTTVSVGWFSILGTAFFLGTIIWRGFFFQIAAAFAIFLPSLLFTRTWIHVVCVILSMAFALLSMRSVEKETGERLRFHFIKNVRSGSFSFVFGLALSLSSVYYASIRNASWEELVPRFRIGEGTAAVIFKSVGYVYPEYKRLSEEGVTVDSFLESFEKKDTQNKSQPAVLSPQNVDQVNQMAANIADVFSYAIQNRMITALSAREAKEHLSSQVIPFTLAFFIFLTLIPVGTFLSFIWVGFGFALFLLLVFV